MTATTTLAAADLTWGDVIDITPGVAVTLYSVFPAADGTVTFTYSTGAGKFEATVDAGRPFTVRGHVEHWGAA